MLQIIIIALVLAADIVTKSTLEPMLLANGGTSELINGVVRLTLTHNTGMAWGLFNNALIVLTIATSIVVAGLAGYMIYSRKAKSKLFKISLALILGGAIGNLYDRIAYGYVIDFFQFEFIDFPIFNVADMAITAGAVCLFVFLLFYAKNEAFFDDKTKKPAAEKEADEKPDEKPDI